MNLLNGFYTKTTNRKKKYIYINSDMYMYTEQFFLNKTYHIHIKSTTYFQHFNLFRSSITSLYDLY